MKMALRQAMKGIYEMLKQLSIYAENKKGTMTDITKLLSDEGINIWGSVTNDVPNSESSE